MKNWTIKKRVTFGFAILVGCTVALGVLNLIESRIISASLQTISRRSLPGVIQTAKIQGEVLRYRVITLKHIISNEAAEMQDLDSQAQQTAERIEQMLGRYITQIVDPRERELASAVGPALENYRIVARQIRALGAQGKNEESITLMKTQGASTYAAFEKSVQACHDFNLVMAEKADLQASQASEQSRLVALWATAAALALGGILAWAVSKSISTSLTGIAAPLADGASSAAAAANQVAHASQSLAEGSTEQAASLEETSASLEEMAGMTKRNTECAQRAKDIATQARKSAESGTAEMSAMAGAMADIKASSDNIAKIIKTIDDIAFQTNILALNAAVEAARAGEAGMGFAVVAEEVRSLAQRSSQAAKDTADRIEDSINKSTRGVRMSEQMASRLSEITDRAKEMDALAGEIATGSVEQSRGIDQLNIAVSQMDKITQASAGNAEEVASSAAEMHAQASALDNIAAQLRRLVGLSGQAIKVDVVSSRGAATTALPAAVSTPFTTQPKLGMPGRTTHFLSA